MENPKLLQEHMGSENLSSINEVSELVDKGAQEISVSHQTNGVEDYTARKASDSFIVDIERFASHLSTDKDIKANSRITLQRSLSRKASQERGGEKKSNPIANGERDYGSIAISPRASLLQGGSSSTPEKPMVAVVGATEHSHSPQVHNPITIMTGSLAGPTESRISTASRRFSLRRSSSPSWTIDPRRILFFFATLSSMGTILLIYFTLSMNKFTGRDNGLN
ncbi:uncharacterized protein LOC113760650 isoform X2 [Coffea eugenioides]|uniref:uncharacterized protein LOC113760650 isoform X2 n=1 Tax=Coffea eugenioides TaxID=49369 RepID=UPI000F611263|nr:uncharacterized protein LOC113760650 isoform X2 [Coffea eugenioides]